MCLQNLFCSLEHVYLEGKKKKNLSFLTIYFLVTVFWDLELDKQMAFTEGIRRNARVCIYILISVCISQIVLIHTAVLVLERSEGTAPSG